MGFGAPESGFDSGGPIFKFSTIFLWDGCPNVSKDHFMLAST